MDKNLEKLNFWSNKVNYKEQSTVKSLFDTTKGTNKIQANSECWKMD